LEWLPLAETEDEKNLSFSTLQAVELKLKTLQAACFNLRNFSLQAKTLQATRLNIILELDVEKK